MFSSSNVHGMSSSVGPREIRNTFHSLSSEPPSASPTSSGISSPAPEAFIVSLSVCTTQEHQEKKDEEE
ncbi:hypothetical protein E2C01_038540 [Portunus trituberculatus]|uniref:Uncharacterized protein n=1 Tax=Portunus trituberculatus TaxID=210409 RepID=A0A5B7FI73_PORTR|nr:hypothetical protein [Portunus trituberculatus]